MVTHSIQAASHASRVLFIKDGEVYHQIYRGMSGQREMLQKISALNDMAHERGESLAQMALNWILKDDALTSVLIGASSPAQIIENTTKIRRHAFTEEELQKIDRIVF